jgi:low temperature requirement protein LtrA
MARDAYTYLHVVMVAGVIVSAVGDEVVIAHPGESLHGAELTVAWAGPALYLLAQALFRLRMAGTLSTKRLGGAVACAVLGLLGGAFSALLLAILLVAVLVTVIAAETVTGRRRRRRGNPSPMEALRT